MFILFRLIWKFGPFVLLLGTVLLLFFIVLSGARMTSPLKLFFWNQVTNVDSNFSIRWYFWRICTSTDDWDSYTCKNPKPALPIAPEHNFGDYPSDAPERSFIIGDFVSNDNTYFYLTRFVFPFFIIALFFAVVSMFTIILGAKIRLFSIINFVSTFMMTLFTMAAAALITSSVVLVRNQYNDANNGSFDYKIGVKMMAFAWTTTAMTLFIFITSCCKCIRSSDAWNAAYPTEGAVGTTTDGELADNSSFQRDTTYGEHKDKHWGFFKKNAEPDTTTGGYSGDTATDLVNTDVTPVQADTQRAGTGISFLKVRRQRSNEAV